MENNDHPFVMTVKPGRYVWCSCGLSQKQPFCDGSHGPTGMRPMFVEITKKPGHIDFFYIGKTRIKKVNVSRFFLPEVISWRLFSISWEWVARRLVS
jgi:hypothetical protein